MGNLWISLRRRFPALVCDEGLVAEMMGAGAPVQFPAGAPLFTPGATCEGIGFFLEGRVRVFRSGRS